MLLDEDFTEAGERGDQLPYQGLPAGMEFWPGLGKYGRSRVPVKGGTFLLQAGSGWPVSRLYGLYG
jgi:hypothetical protein